MRSYSGGPCLDGCEHDDCAEYRRVEAELEKAVRAEKHSASDHAFNMGGAGARWSCKCGHKCDTLKEMQDHLQIEVGEPEVMD